MGPHYTRVELWDSMREHGTVGTGQYFFPSYLGLTPGSSPPWLYVLSQLPDIPTPELPQLCTLGPKIIVSAPRICGKDGLSARRIHISVYSVPMSHIRGQRVFGDR